MTDPTGERNLERLLAGLEPVRREGTWVFACAAAIPPGANPIATVREAEGITLVIEQSEADRLGLGYDFVAAMITLNVHSALDSVGSTAAVATVLGDRGISCNVIAGRFHDHLFVPLEHADGAVTALSELSHTMR